MHHIIILYWVPNNSYETYRISDWILKNQNRQHLHASKLLYPRRHMLHFALTASSKKSASHSQAYLRLSAVERYIIEVTKCFFTFLKDRHLIKR